MDYNTSPDLEKKIRDFEENVKAEFIKAKIGDQINEIPDVDLHFVLPLLAFFKYEPLIDQITNNEFKVNAGYNLVLLYTNPKDSQRAGTVLFGRNPQGLIAAWSNILDDIASETDPTVRGDKFTQAHAHFRGALCLRPEVVNPCASADLTKARALRAQPKFWDRLLGKS